MVGIKKESLQNSKSTFTFWAPIKSKRIVYILHTFKSMSEVVSKRVTQLLDQLCVLDFQPQ